MRKTVQLQLALVLGMLLLASGVVQAEPPVQMVLVTGEIQGERSIIRSLDTHVVEFEDIGTFSGSLTGFFIGRGMATRDADGHIITLHETVICECTVDGLAGLGPLAAARRRRIELRMAAKKARMFEALVAQWSAQSDDDDEEDSKLLGHGSAQTTEGSGDYMGTYNGVVSVMRAD